MNIKILISCHKETDYIKNEIFQPVQGGCALGRKPLVGMLRDDDGENISKKRNEYCELTTQYWAWKNLKADYYGFCHYRRYFCFCRLEIVLLWMIGIPALFPTWMRMGSIY